MLHLVELFLQESHSTLPKYHKLLLMLLLSLYNLTVRPNG